MIKIFHGDSNNVLDQFPDNHFTGIVTDPPYGISMHNKKWDYHVPKKGLWEKCLRVTKPGGHLLCFGGSRTFHRVAVEIEDAGWEIRDCLMWLYATGFPKSTNFFRKMEGAEAQYWDGYGTALKPAFEPIILAMKPIEGGSFIGNARLHALAGINIDGTRIPTAEMLGRNKFAYQAYFKGLNVGQFFDNSTGKGRWPANVIFSHHDECKPRGDIPVHLSSGKSSMKTKRFSKFVGHSKRSKGSSMFGKTKKGDTDAGLRQSYCDDSGIERVQAWDCHPDCAVKALGEQSGIAKVSGHRLADKNTEAFASTASRFFYCAKPSKKERSGNSHPTVKPVELMSYLVKMLQMPQGTHILEPFAGSGTTLAACMAMGVDCTGIEREQEYVDLIKNRLGLF